MPPHAHESDDALSGGAHRRSNAPRAAPAPFDEHAVERYVRYPESLGPEERRAVERSLATNPGARVVEALYREYYDILEEIRREERPRIESFIASLFPTRSVVPLFPLDSTTSRSGRSLSTLIPSNRRNGSLSLFRPVLVLASRDADLLVSILQDHEEPSSLKLYVLATDERRRAHVLITFPDVESQVVTDPSGAANFCLPADAPDAKSLKTAVLHFPVAEIRRQDDRWEAVRAASPTGANRIALDSGHEFSLERDDRTCTLVLEAGIAEPPESIGHVVVTTANGTVLRMQVQDGCGRLCLTESPVPLTLTVRVYE